MISDRCFGNNPFIDISAKSDVSMHVTYGVDAPW